MTPDDGESLPGRFSRVAMVAGLGLSCGCLLGALMASVSVDGSWEDVARRSLVWAGTAFAVSSLGSVFGAAMLGQRARKTFPGLYGLAWVNFLVTALSAAIALILALIS